MLDQARPGLVATFARRGVSHVEYVAALPSPDVWVWLGTETDAQRDILASDAGLLGRVRHSLAEQGVEGVAITGAQFNLPRP